MKDYQKCSNYSKVQKQADRFYDELLKFRKRVDDFRESLKSVPDSDKSNALAKWYQETQKFWDKWKNTRLYKNYGNIYCQIMSDSYIR